MPTPISNVDIGNAARRPLTAVARAGQTRKSTCQGGGFAAFEERLNQLWQKRTGLIDLSFPEFGRHFKNIRGKAA